MSSVPGPPPPDETLFARAAAGDLGAWSALHERLDPALVGYLERRAYAFRRSGATPDDLAQQTWLVAWLRRSAFRPRQPGSVRAWLRRIARYKVAEAARLGQAVKRDPAREAGSSSRVAGPGRSPSSVASGREETAWLRWALTRLAARPRLLLHLVEEQRLGYAQAGARLHPVAGEEAARKLYMRALDTLGLLRVAYDLLPARERRVLQRVEVLYLEAGGAEARPTPPERVRSAARALALSDAEVQRAWDGAHERLAATTTALRRVVGARAQARLAALRLLLVERWAPASVARHLRLDAADVETLARRLRAAGLLPRGREGPGHASR